MISYWSQEDASGNSTDAHAANDLTDNNTVGSATGIVSNGRDYEASSSESHSIADGSQTGLDFGNEDFTIALWVKGEGFSGFSDQYIVSKGGVNLAGYVLLWSWSDDRFRFEVGDANFSTGNVLANTLGAPADATWYFIVCRHNATANTLTICVNDGTVDSASWSNGCVDTASTFRVGANSAGSASFFDGIIDELGIWGRVLTAAEITELYNSGAGRDYAYISGGAAAGNGPIFRGRAFGRGRILGGSAIAC